MSKAKFKAIVKEGNRETARNYLIDMKNSHSKSKGLDNSYQLQPYLQCDSLSLQEKQLLFKFRTFTYEVKNNYKYKYKSDLTCHNCTETDSQEHLLDCSIAENISKDNCNLMIFLTTWKNRTKQSKFLFRLIRNVNCQKSTLPLLEARSTQPPILRGGDVPHVYVCSYT